jgi:hypothetical protein
MQAVCAGIVEIGKQISVGRNIVSERCGSQAKGGEDSF